MDSLYLRLRLGPRDFLARFVVYTESDAGNGRPGMGEDDLQDERIADMRRRATQLLDEARGVENSELRGHLLERALELASAAAILEARLLGWSRR
jgi:hypothetical protein